MNAWFRRGERASHQPRPYVPGSDDGYSDDYSENYSDDPGEAPTHPDAWLLDVQTPAPLSAPRLPTAPIAPRSAPRWPQRGASAEAPLLELRDLTINYGQIAAVRNLSLVVGQGELVALLGANGAGKTTTLRTISGLQRPRVGQILYDGQRIDRLSAEQIAQKGIAHLPEGRGMFPRLTVDENFRMAAYGAHIPAGEYGARLDDALQLFPVLGERMSQLAGTLSGGQQQMLAVARALVTRPRLLMIDELSFGLAPVVVKQLFALLPTILAGGTSILLVEQFVGQALAVATRAYVLEKGELTFAGAAKDLADREGFVESSYLGSGAQRPDYQRTRTEETEMLRVRVAPALVRRLRAVGKGRSLHEMANEALTRYLAADEAANGRTATQANGTPRNPENPLQERDDQRGGAQ
jgi:branched-chain amino acid transport system ATP-binding protein